MLLEDVEMKSEDDKWRWLHVIVCNPVFNWWCLLASEVTTSTHIVCVMPVMIYNAESRTLKTELENRWLENCLED